MSLATAPLTASFDQSASELLDVSDVLNEIIRRDNTSFISRLPMGRQATETKHSWDEDKLNPNTATAAEAIDNSETVIDVASGHGARFKVGTLFRVERSGSTEVFQVTGISSDALTVVRGYGSTSAEDHGTTTDHTLKIIAHTNQENQSTPDDTSRVRTRVSNYVQIFHDGINISYSLQQARHAGVADEFGLQVARRLAEQMRSLDSSLIAGISSGSQGSDTVYRSMGGIIEFASQATGNTTSTSEALSLSVVNTMAKQIWDDGGVPNFILVGGKQARAISTFDQSARRSVYDQTRAGYVVNKVMTDLGFELEVIIDPWVPDDVAIIGDISKCALVPFIGMRTEVMPKTGSGWKGQIYGEYTAEWRNAIEAFAYHNTLT